MNVAAILSAKGNTVEVVGPDTPITVAVHRMATRSIGSLVVVGPDDQLVGVVSERDIVRALEHHGDAVLASCACATSSTRAWPRAPSPTTSPR